MHKERNVYPGRLSCGERPVPVLIRGDQAVAVDNDPLIRVLGAIFPEPVHFASPVAGGNRSRDGPMLQSVREAQDLLLLRQRQAAHFVQDCLFEAHGSAFFIIPCFYDKGNEAKSQSQGTSGWDTKSRKSVMTVLIANPEQCDPKSGVG